MYKQDGTGPGCFCAERIEGDSLDLFYKTPTDYKLVKVSVFADGTLELSRLAQPLTLTFEAFEQLVGAGIVLTDIPAAAPVAIYRLGTFTARENRHVAAIADKVAKLRDMHRKLNGGLTTLETCRQAYERYLATPTTENRSQLKKAYEAVPDYQKLYVGDMDTKDVAVRMILYGEQEISSRTTLSPKAGASSCPA